MNNKFDELTKSLAQSVTRRAALKKFGVGLAGMALACFGLANKGGGRSRMRELREKLCIIIWLLREVLPGNYLQPGV